MKHLLLEVEVSDNGQADAEEVARLLEDSIYMHLVDCKNRDGERTLFESRSPRIRVLTEDNPL